MAKSKKNQHDKARAARAAKRQAAKGADAADASEAPLSPPYGYAEDKDGKRTTVDAELDIIKRIRELGDKRMALPAIAAQLTKEELDCRGEAWTAKRVGQILRRKRAPIPAGLKESR